MLVAPGETLCNTDVGLPVTYVVQADDAGALIHNEAIVTVQTQDVQRPRVFQQTADAQVNVPLERGVTVDKTNFVAVLVR